MAAADDQLRERLLSEEVNPAPPAAPATPASAATFAVPLNRLRRLTPGSLPSSPLLSTCTFLLFKMATGPGGRAATAAQSSLATVSTDLLIGMNRFGAGGGVTALRFSRN